MKGLIIGVILGVAAMFTIPVALAMYNDPQARPDIFNNISLNLPTNEGKSIDDFERQIHELVNAEREDAGLEPFAWDSRLANITRGHSQNMANFNFVDHEDQQFRSAPDRYRIAGYSCPFGAAENVFYYGAESENFAELAVESWMDSSLHRKNILTAQLQNEGIGVAVGENGMYATQNFC